ncbi:MAG: T9SS type A sorting domain-containing protein, partial [Bacteroidales bacterium]
TNNGTLTIAGFQQPTVMGGTKWFTKFENTGVLNITTTSVSGALCLYSGSNLPNVILNSGTMNLNSFTNVIKLNSTSTAVDNFTNTGIINITKGTISSSATSGAILTYPTINNNQGGIINFNYGVQGGSTAAMGTAILSNNNGGIIHGSCTFPASTLVTNDGSLLSPGDFDLVTNQSGIGVVKILPPATGTKYILKGTLDIQVNGSNSTAPGASGTLYDQLVCTEIDVTSANLTGVVGYTPSLNEFAGVVYAATSKTGPFVSTNLSNGWEQDNTGATTIGVKYTGKVAISETKQNCQVINSTGNIIVNIDNGSDGRIDLIDMKGQSVVKKEIKGSLLLPIKGCKGIYLLRVISGGKTHSVKLRLNS